MDIVNQIENKMILNIAEKQTKIAMNAIMSLI